MENYTYVLVQDNDEIPALFRVANGEEQIRVDGEWVDPTIEQVEELEGLLVVTIEESFVDIYDDMLGSKKTPKREDIEPHVTEKK